MKFQWYLVDCEEGTVKGTNDVEVVHDKLTDERYILLTAQHGKYFCGSTDEIDVPEIEDDSSGDRVEEEEDDDEEGESDDDEGEGG